MFSRRQPISALLISRQKLVWRVSFAARTSQMRCGSGHREHAVEANERVISRNEASAETVPDSLGFSGIDCGASIQVCAVFFREKIVNLRCNPVECWKGARASDSGFPALFVISALHVSWLMTEKLFSFLGHCPRQKIIIRWRLSAIVSALGEEVFHQRNWIQVVE